MGHLGHSAEEIGRRGQEIYETKLRSRVETEENIGKIISIDVDTGDYETMILIADGVATFKSEAVVRIGEGLGLPWSLAAVLRVIPRPWRDRLYGVLARNRLRILGRRERCYIPSPADADRFLA